MAYYFIGGFAIFLSLAAIYRPRRFFIPKKKPFLTKERIGVLAVCLVLFLTYFFQDVSSNGDLIGYSQSYDRNQKMEIGFFLRNFDQYKDPVYHFCGLLFSKLSFDFYAWKTLIALVLIAGLYHLLMYESVNPALSVVVFLVLGLYGFSLSGLRQTAAFGILLFTYPYLKGRHFFRFIILVIVASLFHSTALIFLVAYPIYGLKFNWRNLVLLCVLGGAVLISATPIIRFYLEFSGTADIYSSYLQSDTTLSISGIIISGCIWLFCVINSFLGKDDFRDNHLTNLALISVLMRILAVTQFAEFFRISMYFSLFDLLMIPDACSCKWGNKSLAQVKTFDVAAILCLYYFVSPNGNIVNLVFR